MTKEKYYAQSRIGATVYYTLVILMIVCVFFCKIENSLKICLLLTLFTGVGLLIYGVLTYQAADRKVKKLAKLDDQHRRWEAEASSEIMREIKGFPMIGIPIWFLIAFVNECQAPILVLLSLFSVACMILYMFQKYRIEKYNYLYCQQGLSDDYKGKISKNCDHFVYRFFRIFILIAAVIMCVEIIIMTQTDMELNLPYELQYDKPDPEELKDGNQQEELKDKLKEVYKEKKLSTWQIILRNVILISLVVMAILGLIMIIYAAFQRLGKPATLEGDEVHAIDSAAMDVERMDERGHGGKWRFAKDANGRIRKSYYTLVRRCLHLQTIKEDQTHGTSRDTLEEIYGLEQNIQDYSKLYDKARYGKASCTDAEAERMEQLERVSK